ncbi:MAG: hypothetical protein Ta2A_15920 [Treponemataceae bacterium]|nr:MAG: hypothetical protein Ta2A_15920 [Treponemataceae bacterium]
MQNDTVLYQLTVGDVQSVAENKLNRMLTVDEIEIVDRKIGDYIDWYGAIENAICETL